MTRFDARAADAARVAADTGACTASAGRGTSPDVTWGFIWLMFVLKIPIVALLLDRLVGRARRARDRAGARGRRRRHQARRATARSPFPRRPRRGPHGDPALPRPARPRSVVARAKRRMPARRRTAVALPDFAPCRRSVLSDGTIRQLVADGRVKIEPWDPAMVQPASVDLRLGDSFRVFHNHVSPAIDLATRPRT